MAGSDLIVPFGVSRADHVRKLFDHDRTRSLLARRNKTTGPEAATAVLDALVKWDQEQLDDGHKPDTHELTMQYTRILEAAP